MLSVGLVFDQRLYEIDTSVLIEYSVLSAAGRETLARHVDTKVVSRALTVALAGHSAW
jgi:hypothetical protein